MRLITCTDQVERCVPVGRVRVCDRKGIIAPGRPGNDDVKEELGNLTNPDGETGDLRDALTGAHVFIGVSVGGLLGGDDIRRMADDPVVLAMANPIPEIMPDEARAAGAAIVGTGRSDYPNQVNNVLAFPGLFRGALDARARLFTDTMKFAAMEAIAESVHEPTPGRILPHPFNRSVAVEVARRVAEAARASGVCHDDWE